MNNNYVEHIGETVGIYTIIEKTPYKHEDGHALYIAVCNKCGFKRIAKYNDINAVEKCTHDYCYWTNKRIGKIFRDMKNRCYNKENKSYKQYGAKNVDIYEEWMKNPMLFEQWSLQNGYADGLTIDRIDASKGYYPDNCRWITLEDNAKYKSTTFIIDVDGEVHTGKDWARILELNENIINKYIKKYGIDNTIEFIRRCLKNPGLKKNRKTESFYNLYMN